MKLKDLFIKIIKEQDGDATPISSLEDDETNINVVEFPHDNFSVSFFRDKKRLVFTPQEHKSLTKSNLS